MLLSVFLAGIAAVTKVRPRASALSSPTLATPLVHKNLNLSHVCTGGYTPLTKIILDPPSDRRLPPLENFGPYVVKQKQANKKIEFFGLFLFYLPLV